MLKFIDNNLRSFVSPFVRLKLLIGVKQISLSNANWLGNTDVFQNCRFGFSVTRTKFGK